jgi:hypothetical protein
MGNSHHDKRVPGAFGVGSGVIVVQTGVEGLMGARKIHGHPRLSVFLILVFNFVVSILVVLFVGGLKEVAGAISGNFQFVFFEVRMQAGGDAFVGNIFVRAGFEVDAAATFVEVAVLFIFVIEGLAVGRHSF